MPFSTLFKKYKTEILLFSAAVLVRLLFLLVLAVHAVPAPLIGSDSQSYLEAARGILRSGHFINPDGTPDSYEMPAYPLFLLFFIKFFSSLKIISLVQDLLAGISAVLVYRIGLFVSRPVAFGAALLFVFDPAGIYYSNFIVTEPLFIFFLLLGMYCLLRSRGSPLLDVFLPGILLGASTMTRPVGEVLLPVYILFFFATRLTWKRLAVSTFLFVCGFLVLVGPWIIRNEILFGSRELSAVASWQFAYAHAPLFYAYKNNIPSEEAIKIFNGRLLAISPYKDDVKNGNAGRLPNAPYMWRVALDYIGSDPVGFLKFHLIKTIPFFVSDGVRDILYRIGLLRSPENIGNLLLAGNIRKIASSVPGGFIFLLVAVGFLFWLVINTLMIWGVVAAFRKRNWHIVIFVLIVLAMAIVAGGAVSHPRYRYSISPFFFLAAAYGAGELKARLTASKS